MITSSRPAARWTSSSTRCWPLGAGHGLSMVYPIIQGLVNVPIEHHPSIGYIISNRYLKVMFKIPKKGHLPTPVISRVSTFLTILLVAQDFSTIHSSSSYVVFSFCFSMFSVLFICGSCVFQCFSDYFPCMFRHISCWWCLFHAILFHVFFIIFLVCGETGR